MKKLYSCNASVDEFGLVSYSTRTVSISGNSIALHMIHSHTTMSHVRKYIKYLKSQNNTTTANIIEAMYHLAIAHKVVDVIYDTLTGELNVCDK